MIGVGNSKSGVMDVRSFSAARAVLRSKINPGNAFGAVRRWTAKAVVAAAFALVISALSSPPQADETCPSQVDTKPYIQSTPASGPYKLYVLGDSLGDGAWAGLTRRFKGDEMVQVFRKTKVNSGIVRADRYDWNRAILQIAREQFQIAVMMFGANDLQSIRAPGKRHHFNTPGWHEIFNDRIDRILEPLKQRKVAIYWIGLPVVRRPDYTRDYKIVNDVFRQKMEEHGVKFIDVWDAFLSKAGGFVMHGTDVRGQMKVLRHSDGVHFTIPGNEKLASFVEAEIRKDLAALTTCLKKAENAD